MNLRQIAGLGKSEAAAGGKAATDNLGTCMTALIEGAAEAMPRIDAKTYSEFRGTAARMALQVPDRMENGDRQVVVNAVLHEFEVYRHGVEEALHERQKNWRFLTAKLTRELLAALGVKPDSPSALPLTEGIDQLTTAEQIREYRGLLDSFFELRTGGGEAAGISSLNVTDTSTANDNAAGLLGGGGAVEHLKKVMEQEAIGFVVIFRLSCLEMVSRRFGSEAVQDCLMAVAAFLTESLRDEDAIFHWSDSSLVAILLNRPNETLLTAELNRIAARNTDINVNIGGRSIMLRIPFVFEMIPLDRFKSPNDLYKLTLQDTRKG
ncbi:MAG: diguanylate cyclase [Terracidiphilus sp.]|jgi:GGDEF domain-containing protein